jgi:hypothetical protein
VRRLYVGADQSGLVDGRHYTTYVAEVKRLKRAGALEEAERLLLCLIDATEAESQECDWGVAPWYYEQLAIIRRKKGNIRGELEVLERYARQEKAPSAKPSKLAERLSKVRSIL